MVYFISIFSGSIPFGLNLIINNNPRPIIKNLKYGTLSIKWAFKAFVSGIPAVKKLIKNNAIGAASIHKNQTTNPPKIAPKLLPLPPTITITQIKNVIGLDRPVPYELDLQASQWFINLVAKFNSGKLELISNINMIGTISIAGNIKAKPEIHVAEKPKPLNPLMIDAINTINKIIKNWDKLKSK